MTLKEENFFDDFFLEKEIFFRAQGAAPPKKSVQVRLWRKVLEFFIKYSGNTTADELLHIRFHHCGKVWKLAPGTRSLDHLQMVLKCAFWHFT